MSLSYHFRVSNNTIGIIIEKVCRALYRRLQPQHMKVHVSCLSAIHNKDAKVIWQRYRPAPRSILSNCSPPTLP